ncbi:MAG: hypothetical protein RDU14_16920 [Melioribacteraceae bacterium]|nr:hypothetical protein [Melioribacteraceae bacterium]
MSSNKIHIRIELSEKEIPNFINTKIHDSDNRTILGIVKEYDAEKCLAVVDLTEEGTKILEKEFRCSISSQN